MMSNLQTSKNTHFSEKSKLGKNLLIVPIFVFAFLLVGCGKTPITDADMAKKYNMSLAEFQEQKEAAARMNMSIEDHLGGGEN